MSERVVPRPSPAPAGGPRVWAGAAGSPVPSGWQRLAAMVRGREVALVYAGVVVTTAVLLSTLPDRLHQRVVLDSSTNLVNLQRYPLLVLGVSAFVVSSLASLWTLPLLVWAYAALQRWLGAAVTVLAGLLGHVGATLFVAVILVSGISHGRIALTVATTADVGTSYGLATVAGLLVARVPRRWVAAYGGGVSALLVGLVVLRQTFTDLGHLTAWSLGLGLALLASRVRAALLTQLGSS